MPMEDLSGHSLVQAHDRALTSLRSDLAHVREVVEDIKAMIRGMDSKNTTDNNSIYDDLQELRIECAVIKTKVTIYGGLAGVVTGAVMSFIMKFF